MENYFGYFSIRTRPNLYLDMLPDYSLDSEEITEMDSSPEINIEEMSIIKGAYDINDDNNRNVFCNFTKIDICSIRQK